MSLARRPIQIYLEARQDQALRRLAKEKNASISELIRRGIDLLLNQMPVEEDPAYQIIGLAASGVNDIAENHDEYLVQEIEKEWKE
jgi:hypothetical protein